MSAPQRQGSDDADKEVLPRGWHRAVVGPLSLPQVFQETQRWAAKWGSEVSEVLPRFSESYLSDGAARFSAGYQHHAVGPNPAQDQGNYVGSIVVHLLLLVPQPPFSSPPFGDLFHPDTVAVLLREQKGRPTSSKGPANYRTNILEAFELHMHRAPHGLRFVALLARLQELVLRLVVYCRSREGLARDAPDALAARVLAPFLHPSSAREAPSLIYDEDAASAFLAADEKRWQQETKAAALEANDADMRRHLCSQPSLRVAWNFQVGLAALSGQWQMSLWHLKTLVPEWSEQQGGAKSLLRVWEADVRRRAEEALRLDDVLVPCPTALRDKAQMSRLVRVVWEARSSSRATRIVLEYKCLRFVDSSQRSFKSLRKAAEGVFPLRATVQLRAKDCSAELHAQAASRPEGS